MKYHAQSIMQFLATLCNSWFQSALLIIGLLWCDLILRLEHIILFYSFFTSPCSLSVSHSVSQSLTTFIICFIFSFHPPLIHHLIHFSVVLINKRFHLTLTMYLMSPIQNTRYITHNPLSLSL